MFLQQIQCTSTENNLNNSQECLSDYEKKSTSQSSELRSMLAQIDKIICYIDELYQKATNEERTKTHVDEAIKCVDEQLQNLNSTDELVELLDSFSQNNKLKHIIHKDATAVQTASIHFWSAMIKTGKKTSELDTQTLTDLLVLREILVVYQEQRRLFSMIDTMLIAAEGILKNLKKLSKISTTEPNEQQKTHEVDTEPYKLYTKLKQLYFAVKHAKCEYDRQLAEIAKENKISTESAEQQPTQSDELQQKFDQAFTQLKAARSNLNYEIEQYGDLTILCKLSDDRAYLSNNCQSLLNWRKLLEDQSQQLKLAEELLRQISCIANRYADDREAAYYSRAAGRRYANYRIIPRIATGQSLCLLDPAIESGIDECMKHVMDPSAYIVDEPHTNDDNSRLLTIGSIAILGVVTIGAGWYLFSNDDSNTIDNRKIRSNDDNNTASNRKMQLSRKTTTSMQLAKPTNVSATKRTDVSAHNDNTDITTKSVTTSTTTHQEQTSANKQIK
jgi:hypothetical protein